jgi:flagellin
MGLRVNTNIFSMTAQRNLSVATDRLQGNYAKLSSGLRIATAADDAAGLGISERMRSQIKSYGADLRNTQDAVSLAQTAEGALNEVSGNLSRMRELAIQASNGTLSSTDRTIIDTEYQALVSEIDRTATESEFNGIALLDGSSTSVDIQVGLDSGETISIELQDASTSTLGISSTDVTSVTNAQSALADIDSAIDDVNSARGDLGAVTNRLMSAFRSITNTRENLSSAESRIRDVDVASETADLSRNTIMQQASISILAQANSQPQLALSLLR